MTKKRGVTSFQIVSIEWQVEKYENYSLCRVEELPRSSLLLARWPLRTSTTCKGPLYELLYALLVRLLDLWSFSEIWYSFFFLLLFFVVILKKETCPFDPQAYNPNAVPSEWSHSPFLNWDTPVGTRQFVWRSPDWLWVGLQYKLNGKRDQCGELELMLFLLEP